MILSYTECLQILLLLLFCFYVASHSLPAIFAEACINKKNELRVVIKEVQEIPFLAKDISKLRNVVRSRKQSRESGS